jgi:hypothetical protein
MIIRSKNRLYVFDRHISDALLRLSVLVLAVFFGITSLLLLINTDKAISRIFWPRLQNLYAFHAGKELTKIGTSEKSVFTFVWEQMEEEGVLITRFPEYADKISPNNQAVEMIRLRLRDLRIVTRTIGFLALAMGLFLFLISRFIYGNGESRFRMIRRLFLAFNGDLRNRQPHGCAFFFSPLQRKVFEIVYLFSKGNPDGTFQFDLLKAYRLIWPGDETPTELRRGLLTQAFTSLCEDYFYFPMPFGKNYVLKAFCPIIPFEDQVERGYSRDLRGKEAEVFLGGKFQFSTPLYKEYLRFRYQKLPHPIAYALDDRKNPYAFRIYLALWEKFVERRDEDGQKISVYMISLALYELMETVCFEMSYGHETNLLEMFHADITAIRELGLLKSWFIEEHGDRVGQFWYKDSELFLYDSQNNSYHLNTRLLTHKIYYFELSPAETLDKIKIVKRKCAYLDEYDTPCNRPALPNSPYCRRHAKALEYDGQRIFAGRVKALEAPADVPPPPRAPAHEPPPVIIVPESAGSTDQVTKSGIEEAEIQGPTDDEKPISGEPTESSPAGGDTPSADVDASGKDNLNNKEGKGNGAN